MAGGARPGSGRRPKPTALKILAGNPGRRPLNAGEPKPRAGIPECPAELSDSAKGEWKRISVELLALGLLTELDRAALAAYCQAWAHCLEATENIKKFGLIVRTPPSEKSPDGYPIQNPYVAIMNQSMAQMRSFLIEFGMTPSSRSRISVGKVEKDGELEKELKYFGAVPPQTM
jgi:P27 family predicted phage terminase small subunit